MVFQRINSMVFERIPRLSPIRKRLSSTCTTARTTLYVTCIISILLTLSLLYYLAIYWVVVYKGARMITYPVYFDYHLLPSSSTSSSNCSEQYCGTTNGIPPPPPMIPPPTASIHLTAGHTQWYGYDPAVLPHTVPSNYYRYHSPTTTMMRTKTAILKPNYPHFLQVLLTMPESNINRNLGMFMVQVLLRGDADDDADGNSENGNEYNEPSNSNSDEETTEKVPPVNSQSQPQSQPQSQSQLQPALPQTILATSSRPAMLPHESTLVSMVRTCLSLGPLLFTGTGHTKAVVVDSFDQFVESGDRPLSHVEIRLLTAPDYTTTTTTSQSHPPKPIQISNASLQIGREFNLLQRTMQRYFYTSASVGIFLLTLGQGIVLFGLWNCYNCYKRRHRVEAIIVAVDGDGDGGESVEGKGKEDRDISSKDSSSLQLVDEELFGDEEDERDMWEKTARTIDTITTSTTATDDRERIKVVLPTDKRQTPIGGDGYFDPGVDGNTTVPSSTNDEKDNEVNNENDIGVDMKLNKIMKGDFVPYEVFTGKAKKRERDELKKVVDHMMDSIKKSSGSYDG